MRFKTPKITLKIKVCHGVGKELVYIHLCLVIQSSVLKIQHVSRKTALPFIVFV